MDFRETMISRRTHLGISQLDLSEMAGISLATIKDIERGKGNPSLKTIDKILEVLGLEIIFEIKRPYKQSS